MSMVNYQTREIASRVLYVGSEGAGKATNLEYIFGRSATGPSPGRAHWDTTGLELTLGEIRGFTTRVRLWSVTGVPAASAARKVVMGTPDHLAIDGICWVVDSQRARLDAGEAMADQLRGELAACGYDLAKLPVVMQYNKRDLADIASIAELEQRFNRDRWRIYEGVATTGVGVLDPLRDLTKQILTALRRGQ